ncbi:MAG: histidine triad nucleotide-binding protein [Coriobacteriia bacterium]
MDGCIFCMIVKGEIPARKVLEDDLIVAFDDIAPQAPVHTLIVSREHHAHIGDDVPEVLRSAMMAAVPRVAEAKGIASSGYRTIINTGPDAQQSVHHLHVHVMGGRRMAAGMVSFEKGR